MSLPKDADIIEAPPNVTEPFSYFRDPQHMQVALARQRLWVEAWTQADNQRSSLFEKPEPGDTRPEIKPIILPGGTVLSRPGDIEHFLRFPFQPEGTKPGDRGRHEHKQRSEPETLDIRKESRKLPKKWDNIERSLFSRPISKMRKIAGKAGVIVPADIQSRLHLVGSGSFHNAIMYDPDVNEFLAEMIMQRHFPEIAIIPDARAAFLYYSTVISGHGNISERDYPALVTRGTHALWQTMACYEREVTQTDVRPDPRTKRRGFAERIPEDAELTESLGLFDRAFTDYLTFRTLGEKGEYRPHEKEGREEIEALTEEVGLETLVAAYCTQSGFEMIKSRIHELTDGNATFYGIVRQFARG